MESKAVSIMNKIEAAYRSYSHDVREIDTAHDEGILKISEETMQHIIGDGVLADANVQAARDILDYDENMFLDKYGDCEGWDSFDILVNVLVDVNEDEYDEYDCNNG